MRLSVIILIIAAVICCTVPDTATAQGVAMFKGPADSSEEFAKALEGSDPKGLLRAKPEQFFEGVTKNYPEVGINYFSQLPVYVRTLQMKPCPMGQEFTLSRILLPSEKLDFGFVREFRQGEMCFYDNNLNLFVMSATCGNIIVRPPVEQVEVVLPPPVASQTQEQEVESPPPAVSRIQQEIDKRVIVNKNFYSYPVERSPEKEKKWSAAAWWATGAAIAAVAGILIWKLSDKDNSSLSPDSGGPVNPPSRLDNSVGPVSPPN